MSHYATHISILLLLLVANGAPIVAHNIFQARFLQPVDGGRLAWDGRPWFGASKTWRGLLAALVSTPLVAWLLAYPAHLGLVVALGAMCGDLFSSFIKRRLRIPASGQALGLDQIPEALLPLLLCAPLLNLHAWDFVGILIAFFVLELVLSRVLYMLHIRKRPY